MKLTLLVFLLSLGCLVLNQLQPDFSSTYENSHGVKLRLDIFYKGQEGFVLKIVNTLNKYAFSKEINDTNVEEMTSRVFFKAIQFRVAVEKYLKNQESSIVQIRDISLTDTVSVMQCHADEPFNINFNISFVRVNMSDTFRLEEMIKDLREELQASQPIFLIGNKKEFTTTFTSRYHVHIYFNNNISQSTCQSYVKLYVNDIQQTNFKCDINNYGGYSQYAYAITQEIAKDSRVSIPYLTDKSIDALVIVTPIRNVVE